MRVEKPLEAIARAKPTEAQSSGEPCFRLRQTACSSLTRAQPLESGSVLDVCLAIFPVPQRVAMLWIAYVEPC